MAFGDALAQGIIKGMGMGWQDHQAEKRRERREARKLEDSMEAFKTQYRYKTQMADLEKQKEMFGSWEEANKLSNEDLAYKIAYKATEGFSKKDRRPMMREFLKNLDGQQRPALMVRAGYNRPDFSEFVGKPEFEGLIPKHMLAGRDDLPTAEGVFTYTPDKFSQLQEESTKSLVEGTATQQFNAARARDTVQGVFDIAFSNTPYQGMKVSDDLVSKLGFTSPEDVNRPVTIMTTDAQGNQFPTTTTLGQQRLAEFQRLGLIDVNQEGEVIYKAPQEAPKEQVVTSIRDVAVDPTALDTGVGEYEATKEREDRYRKQSIEMSDKINKDGDIEVVKAIDSVMEGLDSLTPEQLSYITGLKSFGGATLRDMAARFGDEDAQKINLVLSQLAQVRNVVLKSRSGAAVTDPEMKRFIEELGGPTVLTDMTRVKGQLGNLRKLGIESARTAISGYEQAARDTYFTNAPDIGAILRTEGTPEDTKQTVSDLSEDQQMKYGQAPEGFDAKRYKALVDKLEAGDYTDEQRMAIMQRYVPNYVAPESQETPMDTTTPEQETPEAKLAAEGITKDQQTQVDAYMQSLSPDERNQLEEEIRTSNASPLVVYDWLKSIGEIK